MGHRMSMNNSLYVVTPRIERRRLSEPQKAALLRAGEKALNGECTMRVEKRGVNLRVIETTNTKAVTV